MPTTATPDWSATNFLTLRTVFAASTGTFLVLTLVLFVCVRLQYSAASTSSARTSLDTLDLTLVKSHTRATRLLSLAGIALQVALVRELTSSSLSDSASAANTSGERAPFLFSLVRPIGCSCAFVVGFMTNTHGAFRALLLLLLSAVVTGDTVAEVQVAMMLACLDAQGLRCGSSGYLFTDSAQLQRLLLRDLVSLFVATWLLLEDGYLCASIGVCGSRFSRRQLSLSRPQLNIRAALALHFPDQFGSSALERSKKKRRRVTSGSNRVHTVEMPKQV